MTRRVCCRSALIKQVAGVHYRMAKGAAILWRDETAVKEDAKTNQPAAIWRNS